MHDKKTNVTLRFCFARHVRLRETDSLVFSRDQSQAVCAAVDASFSLNQEVREKHWVISLSCSGPQLHKPHRAVPPVPRVQRPGSVDANQM